MTAMVMVFVNYLVVYGNVHVIRCILAIAVYYQLKMNVTMELTTTMVDFVYPLSINFSCLCNNVS